MDYITIAFLGLMGYPLIKRKIEEAKRGDSQIVRIPFHGKIQNAGAKDELPPATTPQGLERILKKIKENDRIKGIIFDINSGGGEAGASKTIYDLIKRAKKPKVAYVNSLCASGAYMAACACDEVIAAEDALIGSIGVIMQKPVIEELMKKVGVKMEIIKSGEHKDFMSMFRELSAEERQHLDWLVQRYHQRFVKLVYKSREGKIEQKALEDFACGYVTDGLDAKEKGLIDKVGSFRSAVKACERLGEFKHTYVATITQPSSFFSKLFSRAGYSIGKGFAETIEERLSAKNEVHYE